MKYISLGIVIFIIVFVLLFSVFVVDVTKQAVILEFGKPVRVVKDPGLYFKKPFVQEVIFFEKRILEYDSEPTIVVTKDKKSMILDSFALFRINDPILFLKTVRNEIGAQARLDDIIYSEMRRVVGQYDFDDIVSKKREEVFEEITTSSREKAKELGIEISTVRMKRVSVPAENLKKIYDSMIAERQRQAALYRAEGQREAQRIKSEAEKKKVIILSEAYRRAQEMKGRGEAEASRILQTALSSDPEFYQFLKTLELYKSTLPGNVLIITPDSELFRYLRRK
ncbi:MAG: protease modulator HflC [Dictyoglomus thermophilum]|uniref:Protein HflC n=1 Tax=Dictyoglomus thermophilum TaxID=14 RepID=A0A7C3PPM9_DICTH|nr:protease modulator HflC [Dictyoglomus thermophilum]MCX7720570.1 protease modulator HflC [Dictyoglomus thermophilum]TYT24276.1 protease modulator HflC [Dictyoglomus thermophilum]